MAFLRSTVGRLPPLQAAAAARAYSTLSELRIIGRLVKTESKPFNTANGEGTLFKYTVATQNPSSMRKMDGQGNLVWTADEDRTSSFYEIAGFNKAAETLEQQFQNVLPGSLLHVTASAELKKSSLPGTTSARTGAEIQIDSLQLYHGKVDVLERFDPAVSEFRRERREAAQATAGQQQGQKK